MAKRQPKKSVNSTAEKVERTGETSFVVKHDDGSVFECQVDSPERFKGIKGLETGRKIYGGCSFNAIGEKKPLICDVCKEQVARITLRDSKWLCEKCK